MRAFRDLLCEDMIQVENHGKRGFLNLIATEIASTTHFLCKFFPITPTMLLVESAGIFCMEELLVLLA